MPSRALTLFGTEAPLPEISELRAGRLSLVLEAGQLRRICWNGQEAIRGISCLVRDSQWGTYPVELQDVKVDAQPESFHVQYTGRCKDAQQSLTLRAQISGNAEGLLSFEVEIEPQTDFVTNRAGFVVLHPLEGVAGAAVKVEHTDGKTVTTALPQHVAPHQPLLDIRALSHEVSPGVTCTCTMQGDAFELEDQRNWTDASFKTYVRPASKPAPYTLAAGVTVKQSVQLRFDALEAPVHVAATSEAPHSVMVAAASGALPAFALAFDEIPSPSLEACAYALEALRPQWLVGRLDKDTSPAYLQALAEATALAEARLWLEVVPATEKPIALELQALAAVTRKAKLPVEAVSVSPAPWLKTQASQFSVPGLSSLDRVYSAARHVFPDALMGGGSLAYFTELNRNRPTTTNLDFITHTTCPIIHAADDASVMQTLESLPWVFASTWAFAGQAAYWLGPTALNMRHNPYGNAPVPNPDNERLAMAHVDPRHRGLFGAAFYIGYAARAARAGLHTIALGAVTGPSGVIYSGEEDGKADTKIRLAPAYHAFSWLAEAGGKRRLAVTVSGGAVDGLGYVRGSERVLLLCNTTSEPQPIRFDGAHIVSACVLDETRFDEAQVALRLPPNMTDGNGVSSLTLGAYAIAKVVVS